MSDKTRVEYIYESPDGGKTVTRRKFGEREKETIQSADEVLADLFTGAPAVSSKGRQLRYATISGQGRHRTHPMLRLTVDRSALHCQHSAPPRSSPRAFSVPMVATQVDRREASRSQGPPGKPWWCGKQQWPSV